MRLRPLPAADGRAVARRAAASRRQRTAAGSRGRGRVPSPRTGRRARAARGVLAQLAPNMPSWAPSRGSVALPVGRAARRWPRGDRRRVRPGKVVTAWPIALARWASRVPTRPGRLAREADDAARATARPSVVGLNASIASGRKSGSASSSSRAGRALAHSGYGTSGWAGSPGRPVRGSRAIVERSERHGLIRSLMKSAEHVAAAGRDLLADDHLDAQAAVARQGAARRARRRCARGR